MMKAVELQNGLKQVAKELEISYRQAVFCFFAEDFLRRLGASEKNRQVALHGGLLTYAYTGMIARPFGVIELFGNVGPLLPVVTDILRASSNSTVTVSGITALSENEVQYTASLGNLCLPMRVSVDVIPLPKPELYELPVLLDGFSSPVAALPQIEEEVCRRWLRLLWELPLTGRVDSLFDLFFWSTQFNFTGAELQPVLLDCLAENPVSAETVKSVFALGSETSLERRWRALIKDAGLQPDFRSALGRVDAFMTPVFEAVLSDTRLKKEWDGQIGRWQ